MKYLTNKLAQFKRWILSIVNRSIDDITRVRINYTKNIKQTKKQIKKDLIRYKEIVNAAKQLVNN